MTNDLRAIRLLLVEDNVDHAELMMDTLNDFNVKNTIIHVTDGEKALGYLRQEADYQGPDWQLPDVIFLDIKMPRLDGVSTLAEIKADEALKHIPVIMISTSKTDEEIRRCFYLGASSYISKPVEFEEFSRKIRELGLFWVMTSEIPKH